MPAMLSLEAVGREIQQLDKDLVDAVHHRDAEQLVASYYGDGAQVQAPGRPPITGIADILEFWRDAFATGMVDVRLESQHVESEHELACSMGRYTLVRETQPGILLDERGKYLVVYRRRGDGNWRAIVTSFSSNSK